MSSTEKAVQHTSKIALALLKHLATTAIGSDTWDEIAKATIDVVGEETTNVISSWLNQPEIRTNINKALADAETCMREDPHLPSFVHQKLHATGQTGGFFKNDEHLVKAIGKIASTKDEDDLLKEVIAAFQAVDDFRQFKGDEAEYTAQKFLQCLRHGIVRHIKGDWQEDILNQAVLYTEEQINKIAPTIQNMAEQLDRMEEKIDAIFEEVKNQPSPEKKIPQMPAAWRDFTGREKELNDLRKRHQTEQIIIIHGAPGVGKTALALDYAHQIKDDYPDGQIYLNLRGVGDTKSVPGTPSYDPAPLTTAQILTHILFELGISTEGITDQEDKLLTLYRQVLNGKKLLILLDNASSGSQIEKAVQITPHNFFLVTSRQEDFPNYPRPFHLVEMLPEDAVRFLQKLCPSRFKEAEASTLAEKLGFLPLALRLAGNTLNQKQYLSVEEYLNRLENQTETLPLIEAAIKVSLKLLPTTPINYLKQWSELAVFIGEFHPKIAEYICPPERYLSENKEPPSDYEETLFTLKNYGLLEWDPVTKRYDYHDVLREFARSLWTEGQEKDLRIQHAEVYKQLLSQVDDDFISSSGNEEQRFQQRQQAFSTYAYIEGEIIQARDWLVESVNQDEKDATVLTLCSQLYDAGVYILDIRMPTRERIRWLKAAALASQQTGDLQGEGSVLGNLGNAYFALGEFHKGIEYHQQALVISKEIGDQHAEGLTLGNLGLAYADLGEVQKAIEYYQQALAIAQEIGNRQGEGSTLGNLGNAYSVLGEIHKAIEYYQQALAIAQEIGDRQGEGTRLGNLGIAYKDLGEIEKAIEYHQQALVISKEIGDKRGEGSDLGNLGNAYSNLGEVKKAIEYYQQALSIAREIGDRRAEGTALGNLGIAYKNLGEIEKAIEFYEQALTIAREIGDRHGEGNRSFNLALILLESDKIRAHQLLCQAYRNWTQMGVPYRENALALMQKWGISPEDCV